FARVEADMRHRVLWRADSGIISPPCAKAAGEPQICKQLVLDLSDGNRVTYENICVPTTISSLRALSFNNLGGKIAMLASEFINCPTNTRPAVRRTVTGSTPSVTVYPRNITSSTVHSNVIGIAAYFHSNPAEKPTHYNYPAHTSVQVEAYYLGPDNKLRI